MANTSKKPTTKKVVKEEPKTFIAEWVERVGGQYHRHSVACTLVDGKYINASNEREIPGYASITPVK